MGENIRNRIETQYNKIWHTDSTLYSKVKADNKFIMLLLGLMFFFIALGRFSGIAWFLAVTCMTIMYYISLCFIEPMATFVMGMVIGYWLTLGTVGMSEMKYCAWVVMAFVILDIVLSGRLGELMKKCESIKEFFSRSCLCFVCYIAVIAYAVLNMVSLIENTMGQGGTI